MHRRTLLLDAMGTLLSLDAPAPRLVAALREACGVEVTEAQAGRALRSEIAHYRAHMACARDETSLQALRARCAAVLWESLPPLRALSEVPERTRIEVLLASLHFTAHPDARRLLERARSAGVRVLVVSNWDVSLPDVLERVGLAAHIDGAVVSAVVGAAKPSPVIFARALELAGTPPGRCLHVGDSLEDDVRGAHAAGIEALLLDRSAVARVPDGIRVIRSLDEVPVTGASGATGTSTLPGR